MKTVVPIQLVPDLVEELVVDADGTRLDPYCIRWVINEFDDYAIEQAILLKERLGGQVTVVAAGYEGADDALFTAAAKGADQLIKLTGDFEVEINNHALARQFLPVLQAQKPDLILTGVQAHNRSDGAFGAFLAAELGLPYVGYINGVILSGDKVTARKEYPGGLVAEMEVALPVVLGIQASDTPPRYVPISKIRQVMKTCKIQEEDVTDFDLEGGLAIERMFQPEAAGKADMLTGDVDEIAAKLVSIIKEQGIL